MDDINSQLDEITQRLDDNDQAQQDFSDSLDSSMSDIQSSLDDQSQTISDLQQNEGQLTFPLSQDTIDLITSVFPTGTVTLVAGSATVTDSRVGTKTGVLFNAITNNYSGTPPERGYSISGNTITFASTNNSDTSVLVYQLITLP